MRNRPLEKSESTLGQAVLKLAGLLENEEVKLADYWKLVQLEGEMEGELWDQMTVGWTGECTQENPGGGA